MRPGCTKTYSSINPENWNKVKLSRLMQPTGNFFCYLKFDQPEKTGTNLTCISNAAWLRLDSFLLSYNGCGFGQLAVQPFFYPKPQFKFSKIINEDVYSANCFKPAVIGRKKNCTPWLGKSGSLFNLRFNSPLIVQKKRRIKYRSTVGLRINASRLQ